MIRGFLCHGPRDRLRLAFGAPDSSLGAIRFSLSIASFYFDRSFCPSLYLCLPLSPPLSLPPSLSQCLSLSLSLSLCTPLAMGVAWAARLGARELWWVGCWVAALLFSVFCLFLAFLLPLLPLRDHYKGSRVSQQATRGGSTGVCSIPARLGTSNQLPGKGKI